MKRISSKDLMFIVVLAAIIALLTSILPLNIFTLDILLFISIFVVSGYSLICVLYPEEDHTSLIRKPILILELSMFLAVLVSFILKYTALGLEFKNLTFILSLITVTLSITAYILRLNRTKKIREKEKLDKYITPTSKGTTSKNLIIFTLLSLIMIICVLVPPLNKTPLWMIPGSLFICLIPGYIFLAAIFPKNDDLEMIERLGLSFGLSLILTSLIGLVFNYTLGNIHLELILITLAVFSLIFCLISFSRMKKLPQERRMYLPKMEKLLSIFLIICILLTIGTAAYILLEPMNLVKEDNKTNFTDFYIKGIDLNASGYTLNLTSGEKTSLTMVVVNQEGSAVNYSLMVKVNNSILKEDNITLQNKQKMEIPVNFTAGLPGERNMEFILYKLPDQNPYQTLSLPLKIT
jgi:uncharacterized membrane protein